LNEYWGSIYATKTLFKSVPLKSQYGSYLDFCKILVRLQQIFSKSAFFHLDLWPGGVDGICAAIKNVPV
jgi:hypothetical protein